MIQPGRFRIHESTRLWTLETLLALARRLDIVQAQPPAPLPRHWDRDGPTKDQQPMPAPKRGSGAPSNAHAPSWNHRSKGN